MTREKPTIKLQFTEEIGTNGKKEKKELTKYTIPSYTPASELVNMIAEKAIIAIKDVDGTDINRRVSSIEKHDVGYMIDTSKIALRMDKTAIADKYKVSIVAQGKDGTKQKRDITVIVKETRPIYSSIRFAVCTRKKYKLNHQGAELTFDTYKEAFEWLRNENKRISDYIILKFREYRNIRTQRLEIEWLGPVTTKDDPLAKYFQNVNEEETQKIIEQWEKEHKGQKFNAWVPPVKKNGDGEDEIEEQETI